MSQPIPMSDFDGMRAFNICMAEQLNLCRKLEELADTLPSRVDTHVALMLANQLLSTLRRSHILEEKVIFPVLTRAGTDAGVVLGRLRHKHVEVEDHANDVRDTIQAYITSQSNGDAERLGYMLRCMFITLRMMTIAADPKRMGAKVDMTSVLHTWGSALTHHPHIHMIVPGGGLSPDGTRWVSCKPGFFLHVRDLSRLFRRLFIEGLLALHRAGELSDFSDLIGLSEPQAFATYLAPLRKTEWVVYAKPPFGGPEALLAYLSRYTHRVAISNSRIVSADATTVAFRRKDYRVKIESAKR